MYYMTVCTNSELVAASGLTDVANLKSLRNLFEIYGPVARLLLETLDPAETIGLAERIQAYDSRLETKLADPLGVYADLGGDTTLLERTNHTPSSSSSPQFRTFLASNFA